MANVEAARELLFGAVALERREVDRAALFSAVAAWASSPGRPLAAVLAARGALGAAETSQVQERVQLLLLAHGGDAGRALDSLGSVAAELRQLLGGGDRATFETIGDEVLPTDTHEQSVAAAPDPAVARPASAPPPARRAASAFDTLGDDSHATLSSVDGDASMDATGVYQTQAPGGRGGNADESAVAQPYATFDATGPGSMDATGIHVSRSDPVGPAKWSTLADADATAAPVSPEKTVKEPSKSAGSGWGPSKTPYSGLGARDGGPSQGGDLDPGAIRYRALRLHAKGGLGQVFVAHDEELNREVALKEIQDRHADNTDSRSRFLIEAEVTGGLEHPGIVPVYGLGRYPDGRPYYAMRFIRGESMKEAIERYHEAEAKPGRDPGASALALRTLLGQLVDVCNAMAYAHSRGVLHRDLKPGNVMLGAFGETLVVDWGLAKFQDTPEEAPSDGAPGPIRPMSAGSSSRTLYGSAVGTPQFMSPEQAAGKLDRLGPASDVYSLGAILYTILTGSPAFNEKQLTTLLDKVRKGVFTPPKALNSKVDPALNAVCLKAMALDPAQRYASARDLAADLEHWMADEPVSVYREPLSRRVGRWARRHKTAVASTAALLVTALVSLGIYSVLIKREQQRTAYFYGLARQAVDRMLRELSSEDLVDVPQAEPVRRRMADEAKRFFDKLKKERANDPGAEADVARASAALADIQTILGESDAAGREYREAVARFEALIRVDPKNQGYRADLARALHGLGLLDRKLAKYDDARKSFVSAIDLRKAIVDAVPADAAARREWLDSVYQLAALDDRLEQRPAAKGGYEQVIKEQETLVGGEAADPEDARRLGRSLNNYGNFVLKAGPAERQAARALYERARGIQEGVVKKAGGVAQYRFELARTCGNLQRVLDPATDAARIEALAREDYDLSAGLVKDFPRTLDYRLKKAVAASNLMKFYLDANRLAEAEPVITEAVKDAQALATEFPGRRDLQAQYAVALRNRGVLLAQSNHREEAESDMVKSRDVLRPLVEKAQPEREDERDLGDLYYNLALLRRAGNDAPAALADVREALRLHHKAGGGEEGVKAQTRDLQLVAKLAVATKDYTGAADALEQSARLTPDDVEAQLTAAKLLAVCANPAALKGKGTKEEIDALSHAYAMRSLEALKKVDHLRPLDPRELLKPDYNSARRTPEFQQFQRDLESRGKPKG